MSEQPGSWELEFHRRIVTFLARKGMLVEADSTSAYDDWWADYSREAEGVKRHLKSCELDAPKCTWKDQSWSDFNGTGEPSLYLHGIEVTAYCSCGQVAGRRLRYGGESGASYAKLVQAITRGEGT